MWDGWVRYKIKIKKRRGVADLNSKVQVFLVPDSFRRLFCLNLVSLLTSDKIVS